MSLTNPALRRLLADVLARAYPTGHALNKMQATPERQRFHWCKKDYIINHNQLLKLHLHVCFRVESGFAPYRPAAFGRTIAHASQSSHTVVDIGRI